MIKKLSSERVFVVFMFSFLLTYCIFIMTVLLADVFYVSPKTVVSTLFLSETLFAIKLSFITSIISTFFSVLFAIPGAYALSRYKFPGKDIIYIIIHLPIVLPPLIMGVSLLVFFNTSMGRFLEEHGLRIVYTVPGIIVAQFIISSAFAVLVMKAAYDNIDIRYEQSARTLGCTSLQAFYKITLPLCKSGIIAGIVLAWARAVGEFVPILIVAGAMHFKTEVLPTAIFLRLETGDIEGSVSLTIIMMVICVITLLILKRLWARQ